jgi:hypothetical protein
MHDFLKHFLGKSCLAVNSDSVYGCTETSSIALERLRTKSESFLKRESRVLQKSVQDPSKLDLIKNAQREHKCSRQVVRTALFGCGHHIRSKLMEIYQSI